MLVAWLLTFDHHPHPPTAISSQVTRMLAEHEWITSERHLFGQPNSAYDFKANNPKEAGQRLRKLEETKEKLERNVNRRAMNMLSEAEERVSKATTLSTTEVLWL